MGKNNRLINQYKYMYQQTQEIVPAVYASLAIALHQEYGWGYERINKVFARSQQIWTDNVGNPQEMYRQCKYQTGIDVQKGE